jgi:hypothetical protein
MRAQASSTARFFPAPDGATKATFIGEDDVGFQQVVDCQSELAGEVADATAKGDTADTR